MTLVHILTFNIFSGFWSLAHYFGLFFGPTVAGILVDAFGFRYTIFIFAASFTFVLILDSIELAYVMKRHKNEEKISYEQFE